ncbi:hypothetical protein PVK06_034499 [Gossypium arboreum]|uniref:DDE Tnp4 domain-containing protein n=1 Tax=Gossypium arboreum TaxID=29729 RepID=A0ABR0NFC0_GOSAR|nr:hypothetical protein PVK06_034499 [Gossypium arboreum]
MWGCGFFGGTDISRLISLVSRIRSRASLALEGKPVEILHTAVWFPIFLSFPGSHSSSQVIRLPNESTPSEIRNNPRFYPYFKDCIRALDGTHVRASVPLSIHGRFRSRKGGTTQNVLAAITFDLKFSYVLASWEGCAHDSRILSDTLSRPRGLRIPQGKYYLADAGYGIRNGYITPYRGVRYHLKEFSA